jgi:hypothetical protein
MRLVVRKLEIPNLGQLQSLVIEHLDGIEPGLSVLDSRLLLGDATVDIVALDADGALVLVTAGFTADEDMLLKAVEAYSWCLEYPDAIRRLYPSVDVSAARPPRLMFVVERMPDAFHRKIKQLGFSEVDCVEFRHLDVSGTPAVYFDTIARLRRGSTLAEFQPAPIARLVSEPMRRAPEPMIADRTVDRSSDHNDKVVPLVPGSGSTRVTSVRLQKMLNTNGQGHGVAPVIDLAARSAAAAPRVEVPAPALDVEVAVPRAEVVHIEAPARRVESLSAQVEAPAPEIELPQIEIETLIVEEPVGLAETVVEAGRLEMEVAVEEALRVEYAAPVAEGAAPELENPTPELVEPIARVTLRDAIAAPATIAVATPVVQSAEPRISFAGIAKELLGATAGAPTAPAAATRDAAKKASAVPTTEVRNEPEVEAIVAAIIEQKIAAPVATAAPTVTAPPAAEKPARVVPAPAKPTFTAPKPAVAAATTPQAAAPAAAAASETPAQNLPQEFEGLKFPNDGVLTRQWMEFLNQMASSK